MVKKILPNNNEKCYKNFSPKIFASKHALVLDMAPRLQLKLPSPAKRFFVFEGLFSWQKQQKKSLCNTRHIESLDAYIEH
jgi:hypothetical protein